MVDDELRFDRIDAIRQFHRIRDGNVDKPEQMPPVVLIVGPTATGKTALALHLARQFDGEIIGADAYQIYKWMDIGTAKPTQEEIAGIPYHLIDVVDPDEHVDAHRYVCLADQAIADVCERGKTAIIAGGTGLYTRTLVRGLAEMPGAVPELRESLMAQAEKHGPQRLHKKLAQIDPSYAQRVGDSDLVRIIRALEVYEKTGKPLSELHAEHQQMPDRYPALWIGLDPGRERLRERIARRAQEMFAKGRFAAEVRHLLERGYGPDLPSMRALGYQHVNRLLLGEIEEEEAIRLTIRDTSRYARRQRNWFSSESKVIWIAPGDVREASAQVKDRIATLLERRGVG